MLLVAIEDFVAGLAGDSELAREVGHGLSLEQAGHETQAFSHQLTFFAIFVHRTRRPSSSLPSAVDAG